jgi:hypothetical protein
MGARLHSAKVKDVRCLVTVAGRGNEKAPGCYLGGLVAAVVSLPDMRNLRKILHSVHFRKP